MRPTVGITAAQLLAGKSRGRSSLSSCLRASPGLICMHASAAPMGKEENASLALMGPCSFVLQAQLTTHSCGKQANRVPSSGSCLKPTPLWPFQWCCSGCSRRIVNGVLSADSAYVKCLPQLCMYFLQTRHLQSSPSTQAGASPCVFKLAALQSCAHLLLVASGP